MNKQDIKYRPTELGLKASVLSICHSKEGWLRLGFDPTILVGWFERVEEPKITAQKYLGSKILFFKGESVIELTGQQITAIESLLNEEKESKWSEEEIEAIKRLQNEYSRSAICPFDKFLDSKKGEPKQ